jgi:hypothetical protein
MSSHAVVARARSRASVRAGSARATLAAATAAALLLTLPIESLGAQARVSGTVRDESSGQPLANAEVRIDALERTTRTDSLGRYLLSNLPSGQRVVNVRLIGYHPAAAIVRLIADGSIVSDFRLARAPAVLDTVAAIERGGVIPTFEEHRRVGLGRFLGRAELAKVEQRRLGDVLATFQGIGVVRGIGDRAWIANRRGARSLQVRCSEREGASPAEGSHQARARDCACYAQVYLDDMLLYRGAGDIVPDINRFPLAEIEAIEYYAGPAQTPLKYSRLDSPCGVVVIHTRRSP